MYVLNVIQCYDVWCISTLLKLVERALDEFFYLFQIRTNMKKNDK